VNKLKLGQVKHNGEKYFKEIKHMINFNRKDWWSCSKNLFYRIFKHIPGLIMQINYDFYRPINGANLKLQKLLHNIVAIEVLSFHWNRIMKLWLCLYFLI